MKPLSPKRKSQYNTSTPLMNPLYQNVNDSSYIKQKESQQSYLKCTAHILPALLTPTEMHRSTDPRCTLAAPLVQFQKQKKRTEGSGPDSDVMSYPLNNLDKVSSPTRASTGTTFTCIPITHTTYKLHQSSASTPVQSPLSLDYGAGHLLVTNVAEEKSSNQLSSKLLCLLYQKLLTFSCLPPALPSSSSSLVFFSTSSTPRSERDGPPKSLCKTKNQRTRNSPRPLPSQASFQKLPMHRYCPPPENHKPRHSFRKLTTGLTLKPSKMKLVFTLLQ